MKKASLFLTLCLLVAFFFSCKGAPSAFNGSLNGYTHHYDSGRDRAWEEDVLYLAQVHLGEKYAYGHPLLCDRDSTVILPPDTETKENLFDRALKEQFLENINALIPKIQELTDAQILYEMQKTVALLDDCHSSVRLPATQFLPFSFEAFITDTGINLHTVRVPITHEYAIFSRLIAIGGIPIEDVLQKLSVYPSAENEHFLFDALTSIHQTALLTRKEALQMIGAVGADAQTATLTLILQNGEEYTVDVPFGSAEEIKNAEMCKKDLYAQKVLPFKNNSENYWYTHFAEDGIFYIRINRVTESETVPYNTFFAQIEAILTEAKSDTVVVDLRRNYGGSYYTEHNARLAQLLEKMKSRKVIVLVDSAVASASAALAAQIRHSMDNVLLVGTPTGQSSESFGPATEYTLPNSGYVFTMADRLYRAWSADEGKTLTPDIIIYQRLEDTSAGIDTVWESIKNQME